MAQYGTLQNYRFTEAEEDIRGSKVYGVNDEKLGTIDDVIFDHSTGNIRYAVVDTGGWLSSKKFLVPAERLRPSTKHENDFEVNLAKKQIESFPPYNERDLESEAQWSDYEGKYRAKWEADPVMHREGTDRNITPTMQQMEQESPSKAAADRAHGIPAQVTPPAPLESARGTEDTGAFETGGFAASTDSVTIDSNAVGIGPRWDTFQNRLRERRKEVIGARGTGEYRKAS
jgi:sporulation protein YlmC with PRC-barrel domain